MECLLEVCVDSYESAIRAERGGANRLELCSNLIIGGTSPVPAFIQQVMNKVEIPVNVLLRPRFGDFCYTEPEKEVLLKEIEVCKMIGVNGVVVGALTSDGELDIEFLKQCKETAEKLQCTLHRSYDVCVDAKKALEQAIQLGFDTILTSGQAATAIQGESLLKTIKEQAGNRIQIMAGSGINAQNIIQLATNTQIRQFHLSAKKIQSSPMRFRRDDVPMGLELADEYMRSYTDEEVVHSVRSILNKL